MAKEKCSIFGKLGYRKEKFRWLIAEDISKNVGRRKAVEGVDAITHVASPFHSNAGDPQGLVSSRRFRFNSRGADDRLWHISAFSFSLATNVHRTSFTAAVRNQYPEPVLIDENIWVEQCVKSVSLVAKCCASKALIHLAAWKYIDDHKSELSFDIGTLNLPMVFGPVSRHPMD
ncbi:d-lactaldehyde dehydrogenase [Moniliophthora roreri MCA 2997]|uniref:D-lactaldehyde dehydrogenase n=1 Tax=Moniliophthora roreri (strain MCA 2997) TaxID=1381753 RepID=V2X0S0_MONRO|nr:d-lactaldehyde dehydrogenase [Moniliophthora roreri MCA 2997]